MMLYDRSLGETAMVANKPAREGGLDNSQNSYQRYRELGGIINEKDYRSAIARAEGTTPANESLVLQAKEIAQYAGIALDNAKDAPDHRIALYAALRADTNLGKKKHYSQMGDQRLFAEVLRILNDTNALSKLIDAYHKTGSYCPICLKVVAFGEECS